MEFSLCTGELVPENILYSWKIYRGGVRSNLANLRFQLDHEESGQFGTIEEQSGLEPLEQLGISKILMLSIRIYFACFANFRRGVQLERTMDGRSCNRSQG